MAPDSGEDIAFITAFFARETQNFASLLADAIVMPIPKPSASLSGDAKSCVSRGRNAFILTILLHTFHCHRLLVTMFLWHHKTVGRTRGTDIRM